MIMLRPFRVRTISFWVALLCGPVFNTLAAEQTPASLKLQRAPNQSLQNEVRRSIQKGLDSLTKSQAREGFWSSPDYPAITALCLSAFRLQPTEKEGAPDPTAVKKGYE